MKLLCFLWPDLWLVTCTNLPWQYHPLLPFTASTSFRPPLPLSEPFLSASLSESDWIASQQKSVGKAHKLSSIDLKLISDFWTSLSLKQSTPLGWIPVSPTLSSVLLLTLVKRWRFFQYVLLPVYPHYPLQAHLLDCLVQIMNRLITGQQLCRFGYFDVKTCWNSNRIRVRIEMKWVLVPDRLVWVPTEYKELLAD